MVGNSTLIDASPEPASARYPEREGRQTACCIVGAGAAGAMLALLLARRGVPVILLEKHLDFERQFRGDSLHPSIMEVLDEIGLAGQLLKLPHTKAKRFSLQTKKGISLQTTDGVFTVADFSHLKTQYPYITLLPQSEFLQFITSEAARYPNFQLILGANVRELIEEDGVVRGVRYEAADGWHDVRALLTVGADGRSSHIRQAAGITPVKSSPPMDVLWFRLPREPGDPKGIGGRVSRGHILALLDRSDYWQAGYVIPKGSHQQLRDAGLDALRRSIVDIAPVFANRVGALTDWKQIAFLSVESSHVPCWYRPGLLLIGDAAHVMTPIGGVGINYAIQDAVVAANVLAGPLKQGKVDLNDLAMVQCEREWSTRMIQAGQNLLQQQILASGVFEPDKPFTPPIFMRLPIVRSVFPRLMGRVIGMGIIPVHVHDGAHGPDYLAATICRSTGRLRRQPPTRAWASLVAGAVVIAVVIAVGALVRRAVANRRCR
ncbi:MAG TPA: FAD-dependent oxidoreductase [Nitrolancea sp.]|nr:FAD-dependent oxidoreductase [Nitrolancea sp.]